ncbi:MAG: KH domain-containing protein [Anaerolineae bacterium]|nr:KH domain-containing protein [Anaerolineae bacterium]MCA9893677.1 KH domain-containing protein [Anaerolineae bacterium]MCB9460088.1 KH domain-containing protein [Anaerolineaceae bacterium]
METDLVQYIAEHLVENVDEIKVNQRQAGRTTVIELSVAPDDMGRVIGKGGRVANAMRALLRVAADNTTGNRIVLEIE